MDNFIYIPAFSSLDSAIEYLSKHNLLGHKFSSNLSRFTPEKDILNWVVCSKLISTLQDVTGYDGSLNWNGSLYIEAGGLSQLNPYTNFKFSYESYSRKLTIKTNYRPYDLQGEDLRGMYRIVSWYKHCTDVFANMFGLYCARYGDSKAQALLGRINEILTIK